MKSLKIALLATVAAGVMASVAFADENKAYVNQLGDDNVADVLQNGSRNAAGSGAGENWNMNQNGNDNLIEIDQAGSYNGIGRNHNVGAFDDGVPVEQRLDSTWGRNLGVDQAGDNNTLTLEQTGDRNEVGVTDQETLAGGAGNTLNIDQNGVSGYSHNAVFDVWQRNSAGGGKNTASVTQTAGGFQAGARVFRLTQDGHSNDLDIDQTGNLNVVTDVSQVGNSNDADIDQQGGTSNWVGELQQGGDNNFAKVLQNGSRNEIVGVYQLGSDNIFEISLNGNENGGYFDYGSNAAGDLSLTAGLFQQQGNGNSFNGTVNGNGNVLGSWQEGDDNAIVGIVNGNDNQVAVSQVGNSNFADFSQNGNMNVVAISQ